MEAIKQSSNLSKFEMPPVSDISDFLSNSGGFEVKLVASLRENASPIYKVLKSAGVDFAKSACVLIGPEGDLSDAEYDRRGERRIYSRETRGQRNEVRHRSRVRAFSLKGLLAKMKKERTKNLIDCQIKP